MRLIPSVQGLRKQLGHSQKEMAALLGVSKKAIESYEQGWRKTPPHVEQIVLLHTILGRGLAARNADHCWKITKCPPPIRQRCPARRVGQPGFCWFITGTLCHGEPMGSWAAKRQRCLRCGVLLALLKPA